MVRARWSAPRELADALELLAVEAQVAAAEKAGRLDAVEDELFRFARSVAGAPELRSALSDTAAPVANRASLIEGLLEGRTSEETRRLVRQAVVAPRGRTFDRTVELYGQVAADRRSRLVATVTASAPSHRGAAQPPGRGAAAGSTVTRCTSTSSSTRTSSAASASRSVTRSSTARS